MTKKWEISTSNWEISGCVGNLGFKKNGKFWHKNGCVGNLGF